MPVLREWLKRTGEMILGGERGSVGSDKVDAREDHGPDDCRNDARWICRLRKHRRQTRLPKRRRHALVGDPLFRPLDRAVRMARRSKQVSRDSYL